MILTCWPVSGLRLNCKGACNVACGGSLFNLYLNCIKTCCLFGSVAFEVSVCKKKLFHFFLEGESKIFDKTMTGCSQ